MRVDSRSCPSCGVVLDGAHTVDGTPSQPKSGDLTVCIYCSTPLLFDQRGGFRQLDGAQLEALSPDERAALAHGIELSKSFQRFKSQLDGQKGRPQ